MNSKVMNLLWEKSTLRSFGSKKNFISTLDGKKAMDVLTGEEKMFIQRIGGARGVMIIVVGNGHSDKSSNPGRDWLHFT